MNSIDSLLLATGASEVIEESHLQNRLTSGERLRVKLGIDPSKPDLHIGHAVTLRKLRQFQDAGHVAVLIIGDYTAQIGDPTDRSSTRKTLSYDEVQRNAEGYLQQAYRFIDQAKTEIHFQSEWYKSFNLRAIIDLFATTSVNHLLSHETFARRIKDNNPLYSHELLYPLLQGYDSVKVEADVEIGGVDQKFNVLMGRLIQRAYKMPEQDVVLLRYLPGIDGQDKMSKSLNNAINLTDTPEDVFGKIMSIPDKIIPVYYELATTLSPETISKQVQRLNNPLENPRDIKSELAHQIVKDIFDQKSADYALNHFQRVFQDGEVPNDTHNLMLKPMEYPLIDILVSRAGIATSRGEARRLIAQRGVKKNWSVVQNDNETISPADGNEVIIQVGPRRFIKVQWQE